MDDESKQMLRELLDLQREQTELLRKYLLPPWMRMKFSLRGLLIFMTLVAFILGGVVFVKNLRSTSSKPATPPPPSFVK